MEMKRAEAPERKEASASRAWERSRGDAAEMLNALLADEFVLYVKTRNYHWNVLGMQFHDLHKLFEAQYETLDEFIDKVAERARTVGGRAIGTLGEFQKATRLHEEEGNWPDAVTMVAHLHSDHEAVCARLRRDIETCENRFQDAGTANFLTEILMEHEKMAWMLRSLIRSQAA